MKKDVTILGKFYLKNGVVVEEKLVLNEEECKDVDSLIRNLRDTIERSFKVNANFHFTFNDTTFKGSELAAITIKKAEQVNQN